MNSLLSLYRTLSLRWFRKRWVRAGLIVLSIALGVATLVGTQALNQTLHQAVRRTSVPLAGLADLVVNNGQAGVPADLTTIVAQVPGVAAARPRVLDRVGLPDLSGRAVLLLGIDLAAEQTSSTASEHQVHFTPNPLALLSNKPKAVVTAELARTLPPGTITVRVLAGGQPQEVAVAGTVTGSGAVTDLGVDVLLMAVNDAAALVGRPGVVSRIDVQVAPGAERNGVRQQVETALAGRARVGTPESQAGMYEEVIAGVEIGFAFCGVGALIVGLFQVYNALSVSVAERRHEIGILRALGATRRQVAGLFFGEALFLGLFGSILGVPLGQALSRLALGRLEQAMTDVFGEAGPHLLLISPMMVLVALVAGTTTAVLAALVPALQAANEEAADAVRRLPPRPGWQRRLLHASAALSLIGAGLSFIIFGAPLKRLMPVRTVSFGGISLLLVGALWLMPLLVALAARLIRPLARVGLGIEGRLAADNLIRSPGRTGLVVGALAAGVGLVVQTAGVIRSNEEPLLEWLDQAMASELLVTSGGTFTGGQALSLDPALAEQLQRDFPQQVEAALASRLQQLEYEGSIVLVIALDAQRFYEVDRSRAAPVPGLDLLPALAAAPDGVLISENFAVKQHLHPGDLLHIPGKHGPLSLRVLGTVVNYSWNQGTLLIDRKHYRELFDDPLTDVIDVFLRPGTDVSSFRTTLSAWGRDHALFTVTRDELMSYVRKMLRQVYGVALAQELVVATVAVLGVITALLISVLQRQRELGLLRAVGATQSQVLRTVLAEAALLGLLGTVLGVLVGLPLQWYVVRVLIFEESGFIFPIRPAWGATGVVAAISVGAAAVAGLGPALHAARQTISEAIAYE